jgi:cell division protein FtsB
MGNRPLSNRLQKDRMMKKAGAGAFCFVVGLWLAGSVWAGEEGAAAATVAAPGMATAAPDHEYDYPRKLAELKSAPLEELRRELAEVEARIDDNDIAGSNADLKAVREQVEANSAAVQALRKQITALNEEIRLAIERDPAMVAAAASANRSHLQFMDQLNLRTGLLRLIAEKERQAGWPEPVSGAEENVP